VLVVFPAGEQVKHTIDRTNHKGNEIYPILLNDLEQQKEQQQGCYQMLSKKTRDAKDYQS
jgi:hypothetical protein